MIECLQTRSYIVNCKDKELLAFVLNQINKLTYFRTRSLSRYYISKKYEKFNECLIKGVPIRTGRIIGELNRLGLIEKYSDTYRPLWKNLYKNTLFVELNKKLKNYII